MAELQWELLSNLARVATENSSVSQERFQSRLALEPIAEVSQGSRPLAAVLSHSGKEFASCLFHQDLCQELPYLPALLAQGCHRSQVGQKAR